jgi:hypothetical protein
VATAAHRRDPLTGRPVFLPWEEFLTFCLDNVCVLRGGGGGSGPPGAWGWYLEAC